MKNFYKWFFIFLFPLALFLSFNKHSRDNFKSYHSVIFADAAGYYSYLPNWFIYDNPSEITDTLIKQTGYGFKIDRERNMFVTKYNCGVAILQLPFFLASHFIANAADENADGFSPVYHKGIMVCGVFYLCVALWLIFKTLCRLFSQRISFITILLFFAGTNLYFYTIDEPGMSHIYSFFLLSVILYVTPVFINKQKIKHSVILFFSMSLAMIIRPTNFIFLFVPLFYSFSNDSFKEQFKKIISNKMAIFSGVIAGLIPIIIQLVNWKKIYGSFITYTYTNEHFDFLFKPKLFEVWFSTNNGLFIYSPLLLLSIIGIFVMIFRKHSNGILIGIIFLLISYIFASWWSWWFGCAYGGRSFIDYYPLLCIPFAYVLSHIKRKAVVAALVIFVCGCIYLNFEIMYYYDGCFYGDTWDFATYFKLLQ